MSDQWVECTIAEGLTTWINLSNVTSIEQPSNGGALISFGEGHSVAVHEAAKDILARARVSASPK